MPTTTSTPPGWPFFAPSDDQAVARAFDLAGMAPDEHLVDLGCGDGRVLVAAAQRGAVVTGIECDEDLAASASAALLAAGVVAADRGRVVRADLFEPEVLPGLDPPPDVLFTYLSPAMLQRLTPVLRQLRGARLVTVDYAVPDLVPDAAYDPPDEGGLAAGADGAGAGAGADQPDEGDGTATNGSARLYRLPGRLRRPRPSQLGWSTAGTLCIQPAEVASLTYLDAVHPGGPVELALTGALPDHATGLSGCDDVERGRPLAVDLRWQPRPAGTVAQGTVEVASLPPHQVTVLFADDHQGQWDLSPDGCATLTAHLRDQPGAATPQEILEALES